MKLIIYYRRDKSEIKLRLNVYWSSGPTGLHADNVVIQNGCIAYSS